jgi:sugar/nucleoside kinase (ribokinase family)
MTLSFNIVVLGNQVAELLAWVDQYPGAGDGIRTTEMLWTSGGMGGNLAHAVARLGGSVALISALGDDFLSDLQITELAQAGVNTDYVFRRTSTNSPVTVLMVNHQLQRAGLVIDIQQGKEVQPEEISDELLRSSEVFFTDMVPVNAAIDAAKRCKKIGIPVAFDMQMASEHVNVDRHNENIDQMYQLCDIFISDAENFCLWRNEQQIEMAVASVQRERSDLLLAITMGKEGSVIVNGEFRIDIPAFKVRVVDTIGAGDAYHGAFLLAYHGLNWDLQSAGFFASATAALSCRAAGARNALPTMDEVLSFLNRQGVYLKV